MSSSETFYWHDYETFGADPSVDRPVQFAGLRTDLDFKPLGEPLVLFAKPPRDYLPQPGACLVTGITPQQAELEGQPEAEFIARILRELAAPGTCALGYNSLRFDDTVTRFTLYRNLRDPYAREYGDGRSRWDLIDPVRTAYALRPEGIEWPRRDDGLPSFRLEDLTAANDIEHGQAHDALGDVQATIALAQLLQQRQPKLFQWLYAQRSKQAVAALIKVEALEPLLHVSGMFGARRANLGLVLPLAWNPGNRNELICADLSVDPGSLFDHSAGELAQALYAPGAMLEKTGQQRPALKSVHINRCPVLLPARMADAQVAERAALDLALCREHLRQLREHMRDHAAAFRDKLHALYEREDGTASTDPDRMLYTGGFLSRADRATLDSLISADPQTLTDLQVAFEDARLPEMLFRYRARNYPHTLSPDEQVRWEEFRFARITEGDGHRDSAADSGKPPGHMEGASAGGLPQERPVWDLEAYHQEIALRLEDATLSAQHRAVLQALQHWGDSLLV